MAWKSNQRDDGENPMRERLAGNIASAITRLQSGISRKLNRAFAKLDRRLQVAFFVATAIAMATYSLYLIIRNTL